MPDSYNLGVKQSVLLTDTGDMCEVKKLTKMGAPTAPSYYFVLPKWWLGVYNSVVKRDGKEEYYVKDSYNKEDSGFTILPLSETEALQMSNSPPALLDGENSDENS